MKHQAILCLGSNVAERSDVLDHAMLLIARVSSVDAMSEKVQSPDISGRGDDYLNIVVRCSTDTELPEFEYRLREIESKLGRRKESKQTGVMPLDADIVVWDGRVVSPNDFQSAYFNVCMTTVKDIN